ncbi:hypothetical protein L596_000068 [Steinernema carpocapsae]|uniref:Uncharacterized protein n=1 Tax=Steinernema carpocapsae TaxID=34508 RepID=A0A4V6I6Z9_STECR|nr:hypothetical protein L596_000068 [Steinernema carpocapsae]
MYRVRDFESSGCELTGNALETRPTKGQGDDVSDQISDSGCRSWRFSLKLFLLRRRVSECSCPLANCKTFERTSSSSDYWRTRREGSTNPTEESLPASTTATVLTDQ